jgi:flagellar assembly protein FliH
LRSEPRIIVRVHPDLVPELQREFLDLQAELQGTLTVLPAKVEHGDVKVEWENGALTRDTRQILQAMQDALAQLGLQQPQDATTKRTPAHAE